METRRGKRGKAIVNQLPLRIASSGVSCLLTINLYKSILASIVTWFNFPIKIHISAAFQPAIVAVLAFLAVFLDLSFGRDVETVSEHMQEVCGA